jgi:uncharacterized protein (DUF362 family)/Pyruvate/2-oxoacid:ferredoxin oxidoreductase delta subunit
VAVVLLERCQSYSLDTLRPAVERVLSAAIGDEPGGLSGERVLLKPNLLSAKEPARCITTHPSVVEAVIDCLEARGAKVHVGDSPAGAVRGVKRVWENTGMMELCERRGVELVNFEAGGWVSRSTNGRSYEIAASVLEFDRIVNIPKLKTHILTLLTGSIKNMFGCVPGFRKSALHLKYPSPTAMSRALVDVFSLVRPWVTVVDAVDVMEGNGPSSGRKRHLGLIAAGRDCIALDTVLARLLGIDPMRVPTTAEAYRRGLGEADPDRITVDGPGADELATDGFMVPANWKFFLVPGVLGKLAARLVWVRPRPKWGECTGCGECEAICAAAAIRLEAGKPVVDENRCTSCLCCIEACAFGAIEARISWFARFLA